MGRWRQLVAWEFVAALAVPPGRRWRAAGCGPSALADTICCVLAAPAAHAASTPPTTRPTARSPANPRVLCEQGDTAQARGGRRPRCAPSRRHALPNFDDYGTPFPGGRGPAPATPGARLDERRAALREHLRPRAWTV